MLAMSLDSNKLRGSYVSDREGEKGEKEGISPPQKLSRVSRIAFLFFS